MFSFTKCPFGAVINQVQLTPWGKFRGNKGVKILPLALLSSMTFPFRPKQGPTAAKNKITEELIHPCK